MTPRLRWTAGPDRVGHASRGAVAITLCGSRAVLERWSYPARELCIDCLAAVAWPTATVRRVPPSEVAQ